MKVEIFRRCVSILALFKVVEPKTKRQQKLWQENETAGSTCFPVLFVMRIMKKKVNTYPGYCHVLIHCVNPASNKPWANKTLVCPVCRKKHRIQNKEKSFSRNEYLLVHIQKKSYKRCQNHDMVLTLFCYEDICCKPICISCLADPNKHDIKRIETREIECFRKELKGIKTNLEAKVKLISEARKCVADKTSKLITTLRKVKKQIDKTIKEAESNQTVEQADTDVMVIMASIEALNNMEEKIEAYDGTNTEAIKTYRETVEEIIGNTNQNLSDSRSFQFPVFNEAELTAEEISAQISQRITKGKFLTMFPKEESAVKGNQPINAFQLECICEYTE